ncbi:MAG: HprK-related kinase A [Alteromonas sp.]|uniref:HprK-related kinase A n=1 Tax=Alteromonas sp. TaxID=232 RepID=UPI0032D9169C
MTIAIDSGPYTFSIKGLSAPVVSELSNLYSERLTPETDGFYDFSLSIENTSPLRRFFRRQRIISVEGVKPFNPISDQHLLPSIEWAMNWAVAAYQHTKLSLHSSVVVKNGKAILFPASSGSGKSTLATYLGYSGWQMFSDEMALIDPNTLEVSPLYRPASLKNKSIDVIKALCENVNLSNITRGTHKGDIAHARLYTCGQFGHFVPSKPKFVVFPRYVPHKETTIRMISSVESFAMLLRNTFNYNIMGKQGFSALSEISASCQAMQIEYSDAHDLNDYLSGLVE